MTTDNDTIYMGANNRGWILDGQYDNEAYWAHWETYLGGTLSFDVNVDECDCNRAAGVFLVQLDDGDCSWDPKPSDMVPQCAAIDIFEANKYGLNVASHPCTSGQCDIESLCKVRVNDDDYWNYGYGDEYTINTENDFSVQTKFYADRSLTGLGDIHYIETTLSQDGRTVVLVQDCKDYLAPFSDLL